MSDRVGQFAERRGDPQRWAGVDSKVVVAAAQILDEGVPGDHHLCGAIRLESPHRSQPALELTVIGFYRIVGVLLDVVPRGRDQLVEHAWVDGGGVGDHSVGVTFNVLSARRPVGLVGLGGLRRRWASTSSVADELPDRPDVPVRARCRVNGATGLGSPTAGPAVPRSLSRTDAICSGSRLVA